MEEFYRDKSSPLGRGYRCKLCSRAIDRVRDKSPNRVVKAKKWSHSEEGKERLRIKAREDYAQNKDKYLAQRAIRRFIKLGVITQLPCAICGNNNSGGHHPDYSHPLRVVWLCQKHHSEMHRL